VFQPGEKLYSISLERIALSVAMSFGVAALLYEPSVTPSTSQNYKYKHYWFYMNTRWMMGYFETENGTNLKRPSPLKRPSKASGIGDEEDR
jgi:hypothetical protein